MIIIIIIYCFTTIGNTEQRYKYKLNLWLTMYIGKLSVYLVTVAIGAA